MLTEETRNIIDHWVSKFPQDKKRSALIQSLMAAQEQNGGWISPELTEAVADYLELPPVWAHEVVSFYSMFFSDPVGRHKVHICTNISCWLNGADDIVARAEEKLGVKLGETTEDGRVTLVREEECLAGCCGAPMAVIDGHYHENLDLQKLDAVLDGLE
ncbi:MAG: NAD(P)H-dependent oxidoreductase subunit E [Xanthomonadales bacterium]|nr:NAD(P)H-dependent oxidoreductase subunit E [Gammaproteobacteria bacterium]MBT8054481.1 NAD(P)H-dependent oxidoreductase subunit E [Gammaproteobacteria bacterium]NND57696.1 NAD(P)H-dependent oxidoreductase subunit E [Xanthomonadales bacterium]NNK52633.1 NAD(P)H-dependent oxidoreductase subunit E [Xanthomonadales bacterium]